MWPDPAAIAGSPRWHFFDFDAADETATLLELTEPHYRQASFLDQRVAADAVARADGTLADLAAALAGTPSAPAATRGPRFIFHIGHCGSTLLSRALDASLATLPLREPLTLRRLATLDADERKSLLDLALRAHERVFRTGQVAVIKATSTCNGLIRPLLDARPGSLAMLMYVDLETYLAGMLGKRTPPLDLRGHLPARLADWSRIDGAPPIGATDLDEAQLAVLAWLTGMRHLVHAADRLSDRVRLVDFERFLAEPEEQLVDIAAWLGFGDDREELLAAWPDVSTGYSKKPDEPYSAFDRRKTLQRGRTERADEITRGIRWARDLVRDVEALNHCQNFFGDQQVL